LLYLSLSLCVYALLPLLPLLRCDPSLRVVAVAVVVVHRRLPAPYHGQTMSTRARMHKHPPTCTKTETKTVTPLLELGAREPKKLEGIVHQNFALDAVGHGSGREHQFARPVLAEDERVVTAEDHAVLAHLLQEQL
jgi:hypothetical protein